MMDCAMHTNVNLQADTTRKPTPKTPAGIWFGGLAVRTIFLIVLTVLTARVASPQIENIWSVSETPGDLIRVALGFAVCVMVRRQPFHFAQRRRRLPNLAIPRGGHFALVVALRHRRLVNSDSAFPSSPENCAIALLRWRSVPERRPSRIPAKPALCSRRASRRRAP